MREVWPNGTVLHLKNGIEYTITGHNEVGGTAIIYYGTKDGCGIRSVLKEFYPEGWVRHNGVPVQQDCLDDDSLLPHYCALLRKQAELEKGISQQIADQTAQIFPQRDLLEVQWIREPDGTEYKITDALPCSILEMDDLNHADVYSLKDLLLYEVIEPESPEHPLGNRQPGVKERKKNYTVPPLSLTLNLVYQLLNVLIKIHNAGFLYGDLNLGNVFLTVDHSGKHIIDATLIDFGCARRLEDGKTAPIGLTEPLMATPGFCAPELGHSDGTLRLTPKADVYALGKILYCLLNQNALQALRTHQHENFLKELAWRYGLNSSGTNDPAISPGVKKSLDKILIGAAKEKPEERLSAEEMLDLIDQLRREIAPPAWQVKQTLPELNSNEVLGRQADITRLEQALLEKHTLVLYGFSGIGKTKLVTLLGHDWEQRYLRQVFYAFFPGSMQGLVADTLARTIGVPLTETRQGETVPREAAAIIEDVFREMNAHMREDDLLIIDNVDDDTRRKWSVFVREGTVPGQGDLFTRLCTLRCKVLFVTRMDVSDMKGIAPFPIGKLPPEPLRAILRKYSEDARQRSDKELDDLVELVDRHTMTVDLIARTLQESRLTVPYISEELRKGKFNSDAFAEVAGEKDTDPEELQIEGHLICLFRLTHFNEDEQKILRYARLIGESYGMRENLFLTCCPHASVEENTQNIQALDHLVRLGYIQREKPVEQEVFLRLHTLIRVVAKKEIPLKAEQADSFLQGMPRAYRKYLTKTEQIVPKERITMAEAYALALDSTPEDLFLHGYWASCASAWYFNVCGYDNYSPKKVFYFSQMMEHLPDAIQLYKKLKSGAPIPQEVPDVQKKVLELYWNLWNVLHLATPGRVRKECNTGDLAQRYWTFCMDEPARNLRCPALFHEYQMLSELLTELWRKLYDNFQPETFADYWVYTDISSDWAEHIRVGKNLLEQVKRNTTADHDNAVRIQKWILERMDLLSPKVQPAERQKQVWKLVQEYQEYLEFLANQKPIDITKFLDNSYSVREICHEELGDDAKCEAYAKWACQLELDLVEHPERYCIASCTPRDTETLCRSLLSRESDWQNDTARAEKVYNWIREACQRAVIDLENMKDSPVYEVTHNSLQGIVQKVEMRLGDHISETQYEQRYQEVCHNFVQNIRQRLRPLIKHRMPGEKPQFKPQPKPYEIERDTILAAFRSGCPGRSENEEYRKIFFSKNWLYEDALCEILNILDDAGNYTEKLKWQEAWIDWKNSTIPNSLQEHILVPDIRSLEERASLYTRHFELTNLYRNAIDTAQLIGNKNKAIALAEELFYILSADRQIIKEYSLKWTSQDLVPWMTACSLYAVACCEKKQYARAREALQYADEDFRTYWVNLIEAVSNQSSDKTDDFYASLAVDELNRFLSSKEKAFPFFVEQQLEMEKLLPEHHPLLPAHEWLEIIFCPSEEAQDQLLAHNEKETELSKREDWTAWWDPKP